MNEHHCCFTGHRKLSKAVLNALPEILDRRVNGLYSEGIHTFYAGGALGFDTLAAEAVIRFREKRPGVRLILALPCKNQTRRWKPEALERYEAILNAANKAIFVSEEYDYACMRRRNEYMVNRSSVCVCYLTQKKGGTAYTVSYAAKKGLRIINLAATWPEKMTAEMETPVSATNPSGRMF